MEDYQKPLERWDENIPPFFHSAPDAPKDWTFFNENGVFRFPKIVFKAEERQSEIIIKVGTYEGFFDAECSIQADGRDSKDSFTGRSCGASVRSALRNGHTTEKAAIEQVFREIMEWWKRNAKESALVYQQFLIFRKEFLFPAPKQLALF